MVSLIVSLLPSNDLHRSANNSLGRSASGISSVSSIRSLVATPASTRTQLTPRQRCFFFLPQIPRSLDSTRRIFQQEILLDGLSEDRFHIGTGMLHPVL